MLVTYFAQKRRTNIYANALFVVAIEANYGGFVASTRVANLIQPGPGDHQGRAYLKSLLPDGMSDLGRMWIISKGPKHESDPGVWTNAECKVAGARNLEKSLICNNLRLAADFISTDKQAFCQKIFSQLSFFRKEQKALKDPVWQEPKYKYHGKAAGRNDDVVICLILGIYWPDNIKFDASFREYCSNLGIAL